MSDGLERGPGLECSPPHPLPPPNRFGQKNNSSRGKILTVVQPDTSKVLSCSCPFHRGPRQRGAGWFPRSGVGYRNSWCRDCLRPLRAANAARRRAAGVSYVSPAIIGRLMYRQLGNCGCGCGRSLVHGYHIDHWNPIANGGRHEEANLRLLTPRCNLLKGKKLPRGVAPIRLSSYRPLRQGK